MKKFIVGACLLALSSAVLKPTTFEVVPVTWEGIQDIENYYNIITYTANPTADTKGCNVNACTAGAKTVTAKTMVIVGDNDATNYKLCICESPNMQEAAAGLRFGLVPKWIRQKTKVITIASVGYTGPIGAGSDFSSLTLAEPMRAGAVIRAATRNYDAGAISGSPDWAKAIAQDTCVYDSTSNTNVADAFSQMALVWMKLTATNGKIDCMKNQLLVFSKLVPKDAASLLKMKQDVLIVDLSKYPTMLPDAQRWVGKEALENYYVSTPFKTSPQANLDRCDVPNCQGGQKTVTAFDVAYNDGTTHKFCVCEQPVIPLEAAATRFGYVPKFMRVYTEVMTIGSNVPGAAYATGKSKTITMQADLPPGAYVHESGHNFDANANPASVLTETKDWKQAALKDTCVACSYARTSLAEDFAETGVIRMLAPFLGVDTSCMKNQLDQWTKWVPQGAVDTPRKQLITK